MNSGTPSDATPKRRYALARVLAVGALLAGVAWVVVMFFGDGGGRQYKLLFETGGQLVQGNEVLVAGQKVGTIDSLDLTDDGQAGDLDLDGPALDRRHDRSDPRHVPVGHREPLHRAANGPERPRRSRGGSTITADATTSPVDIDQLFSIFDEETRESLQDVIKGQAAIYAGDPEASREAYKYLAPGLQSTERFLAELTDDQAALSQFLQSGSQVLGAVAERRDDLSALTENANSALSAIAAESESLDQALSVSAADHAPGEHDVRQPARRSGRRRRARRDGEAGDQRPCALPSRPATVCGKAVPVLADLSATVAVDGPSNDLTDALLLLPELERRAAITREEGIDAMDVSEANIEVTRAVQP